MRHLLAPLAIASVVLVGFSGCEKRDNMNVVPNRDDHAYAPIQHRSNVGVGPVASNGEMYYTIKPGDTLYNIAKVHNMPMDDLIRRNQIKPGTKLKPGEQIIVPKTTK